MGIATWKLMTALSVGLIVFAVYVSVTGTSLGPRDAIVTFALALLFSGVLYVTVRFGYRLGNSLSPDDD